MDYKDWLPEYRRIAKELSILPRDDYDARDLAAQIIGEKEQKPGKLKSLIKNREVIVFGAGPSIEEGLQSWVRGSQKTGDSRPETLIAADGAASCLLENGIYPEIVVTDLDGELKDLLLADRFGAVMVVHAHGDNQELIKKYLPKIKNPLVTTQVEPLSNVHNFGGFTDGDRAVLLARHFQAKEIKLIGFDFEGMVGKYSDPNNPTEHKASEQKRKKLEIAKKIIEKK